MPKVRFHGFSPTHRKLLNRALSSSLDTEFREESIFESTTVPVPDDAFVIGEYGLSGTLRDAAFYLRTRRFIWNPIIILQSQMKQSNETDEWALYYHRFPPDIDQLIELLAVSRPLSLKRQTDILQSAIIDLWQDINHLTRAAAGAESGDEQNLCQMIDRAAEFAASEPDLLGLPAFAGLTNEAQVVRALPSIDSAAMHTLLQTVVEAEAVAREKQVSDRLRSELHRLSNALRMSEWSGQSLVERANRIVDILSYFPADRMSEIVPEFEPHFQSLRDELLPALQRSRDLATSVPTALQSLAPDVEALAECAIGLRRELIVPPSGQVKRIVVIEDDAKWREQILGVVAEEASGIPTDWAGTLEDAEELLDRNSVATLALVDLGLPCRYHGKGVDAIDLDAGLKIIKARTGRNSDVKFIVLTAAQNYGEAVRSSIAAGLAVPDYIQKDPAQWEMQLRSRVQLAVSHQKRQGLPKLDVFSCTSRLMRLDGVEVALDRKPFIVLEYLARHGGSWCTVDEMRADLTQPGPRDITPSMSKEQLKMLDEGYRFTPYDLLTSKHIQDYIYSIRTSIDEAFRSVGAGNPPDIIVYSEEFQSYQLQAAGKLYDSFAEFSAKCQTLRVLIVEDQARWAAEITAALGVLGFDVRHVNCVDDFGRLIQEWVPDIVILDLQLPRTKDELNAGYAHESNGVSIMRKLSAEYPDIRVTVLTSIAWNDSVMLDILREGVSICDYIDKKWDNAIDRLESSVERLMLEVERGARISPSDISDKLWPVSIKENGIVRIRDWEIRLSPASFAVFSILMDSPNAPIDRDTIVDTLWDAEELSDTYENNLNTIIRRLRKEISDGTGGMVEGKTLIRSADGVYWLQGVVLCER